MSIRMIRWICALCFVTVFSPVFGDGGGAAAEQLTGSHVLSQDKEIVIEAGEEGAPGLPGAVSVLSGHSVIGEVGVQLSLDVKRPSTSDDSIYSGIYAEDGTVSVDKLYIIAGEEADYSATDFKDSMSVGIVASGDGKVKTGDDTKIYSLSDGKALFALTGGSILVGDGATLYGNISNMNDGVVDAAGGNITIGGNVVISNDGSYAMGGAATGGEQHIAVAAREGGSIVIGDRAAITASGDRLNRGLYVAGRGSSVEIGKNSSVTVHGGSSYGALAFNEGLINIGCGSAITTDGQKSHALYARTQGLLDGSVTGITTGDGVAVSTSGNESDAVIAFTRNTSLSSEIFLGRSNDIVTSGNKSIAVTAIGNNALVSSGIGLSARTSGNEAYGLYAYLGGRVSVDESAFINTGGTDAHGLYAAGAGSVINLAAGASVITAGGEAHGVLAYDGGTVSMDGASISVNSGADSLAVYSYSETVSTNITGDGVFTISGNIVASSASGGSSAARLTLRDGSKFTGLTALTGDGAKVDLRLLGADTRWNVTGDSRLTELVLDNSIIDYRTSAFGTVITAANLNASAAAAGGTLVMKTDIVNQKADLLRVTGTTEGVHSIYVVNDGSSAAVGNEKVLLVETPANQNGGFRLAKDVELGAWQYALGHGAGGSLGARWYLYATGEVSAPASAAINNFAAAYILGYVETRTLIQRLGDLRETSFPDGLWFRAHGGKFEFDAGNYARAFDMEYGGVQIGYDRRIDTGRDGGVYAGIMFGYSRGDIDYLTTGSGTADSKTLGAYGTFIGGGFYADLVLKYQWIDGDLSVTDSGGSVVTGGDVRSGAFGASLELGRRIHFEKGKKTGWYAEPQAQISYLRLNGGTFNLSNGLTIGAESFTSLIGRVGLLIGRDTEKINVYAKVFREKEFDGDLNVVTGSSVMKESFGGSWWVYGLGVTAMINGRNSVYAEIGRTSGGAFTQPWAVKAGWRMTF